MMSKNAKRKILTAAVLLSSNMLFNFGYAENIKIESVEDYNKFIDDCISGSIDGSLNDNIVSISDANNTGLNVTKQIYGARAENAGESAENNKITINGGIFGQNIYGAWGRKETNIQTNSIKIINGNFQSDREKNLAAGNGGFKSIIKNNKIEILSGNFKNYSIYGGSSSSASLKPDDSSTVQDNKIVIYNGTFEATTGDIGIYGGNDNTVGNNSVNGNIVEIYNAIFKINKNNAVDIYGGYSLDKTVENNKVIINDGEYYNNIYGGHSSGQVKSNKVIINGGTFYGDIYGADGGNDGRCENNKITINGGIFYNTIYASNAAKPAIGNKIELISGNLENAILSGKGRNEEGEKNALIINGWSGKVKAIERFNNINFENFEWQNGGTVIEIVQGKTESYLKDTNINLNNLTFAGGTNLAEQESMTLIKDTSYYNLGIDIGKVKERADFTAGVAKVGTGETSINENGDLIYTITSVKQNDQTKLVAENRAVAAAFINQGTDLIADSLDTISRDGKYGIKTFAAVHGNRSKYDVNSDIKINGWSTIVGVGSENEHKGGDFSWGVFYENGSGNYRTYNEFNNEFFRGDGSLVYNGGGIAARYENAHGVYTEGSLRAGMLKSEMTDALSDGENKYGYKSESEYYGAHIGIGQIISLTESSDLDVYGKFFHTYTEGDSFNVAGDEFEFDSINSDRLRVGARLTTNKENKFSTYYGLAYEYEFNGDAEMRAAGMDAPTQSLQGSSYMAEIGLNYQPTPDSPWSFDLNMRGYAGEREGATFNVQATYTF